ncbi:hypothetical protein LSAT2_014515 [Lamellibrachia satsuma]|nr:hypothetical protein LSAT2_014515 [Lamellibrachia satsuma]
MFLRAKKFSQLASRELLEMYLERRQLFSDWFQYLDPSCPKIQSVLDNGFLILLPGTDDEGRRVFILRPGAIDPSNKSYTKRLSMKHQTYVTIDERKNFIQSWQKHFPVRIKGIHVYNAGAFTEFILMLVKLAMSSKIQKRVTSHGQNLETLYKSIPMRMMPDDYLPDEYDGPTVGSIKDVIAAMKKNFAQPDLVEYVKRVSSSKYGIDLSQRPKDDTVGSFRKLAVD